MYNNFEIKKWLYSNSPLDISDDVKNIILTELPDQFKKNLVDVITIVYRMKSVK